MPADLCLLTPFENGHAREFRAVIRDKRPGLSAAGDNSVQFSRDPLAGQRRIRDQGKTFATVIVNHSQNPEPTSVRESIRDKIQRPAVIDTTRYKQRSACAQGSFATATLAKL